MQTDQQATNEAEDEPREAVDPATLEGMQARSAAQASLQRQLRTGEMPQDAYDEALTSLIETASPAVLKACVEKRRDVLKAAEGVPPLDPQECPFVIVYHPERQGPPQRLGSTPDANAATVTAHEALDRLRKQGRDGEVRVVRHDPDPTVVLRLPLVARPTRIVATSRVRPPATSPATSHAGWTTGPR